MPVVTFLGRVLPAASNLSLPGRPTFNWKVDHLGLDVAFRTQIENGSIRIECELERFDSATHLLPVFVRACDIASASVDLAAFTRGEGLTAVLDTVIEPNGAELPVSTHHASLGALVTAVRLDGSDFENILRAVLGQPILLLALRDLIDAVLLPHRAGFHCTRAIGNIGQFFGARSKSPESGWIALREALQVAKTYMEVIRQNPPRSAGTDEVSEATRRGWVVMNRLIEYLKRGQPLPLSEFPLLT